MSDDLSSKKSRKPSETDEPRDESRIARREVLKKSLVAGAGVGAVFAPSVKVLAQSGGPSPTASGFCPTKRVHPGNPKSETIFCCYTIDKVTPVTGTCSDLIAGSRMLVALATCKAAITSCPNSYFHCLEVMDTPASSTIVCKVDVFPTGCKSATACDNTATLPVYSQVSLF